MAGPERDRFALPRGGDVVEVAPPEPGGAQRLLEGSIKDSEKVAVSVRSGALTLNGERVETEWAEGPKLRVLN